MANAEAIATIADALISNARTTAVGLDNVESDPRMRLSPAERDRALSIKAAVEADHRLRNLTDFEYVQYAITTQTESLERICERCYLMQCFKEEYKLTDDVQQGIELFLRLTVDHPGLVLSVEYLPSTENYICIADNAAFFPSTIQTYDQNRVFFGGIYYEYQCRNPDFRSIRNGMSWMTECMDSTFANLDPSFSEKIMVQLVTNYPMKVKELFFLNSNTFANMLYAIWKRFLPLQIQKAFQLGHQIEGLEGKRIDTIYNSPTPEDARARMLLLVLEFLKRRKHNEEGFSLDRACLTE